MNYRKALVLMGAAAGLFTALYAAQKPFRVYPSMEPYDNVELPDDYQDKTEWIFARLMYPQHPAARFGGYRRFGGGTAWVRVTAATKRHFHGPVYSACEVTRSILKPASSAALRRTQSGIGVMWPYSI